MCSSIEDALRALRRGIPVVVMDDMDRENEGDLVLPAQFATQSSLAFMCRHSSGLLCAPITEQRARELDLPPMTTANTDRNSTAFTVSVDVLAGTTTGASAGDRALTALALADPSSAPSDFSRPGHLFPLVARNGGVLVRNGHTEASVDLCRLAGAEPAAVIAELMHQDGSMMRFDACKQFASTHNLPLITIEDLQQFVRTRRQGSTTTTTTATLGATASAAVGVNAMSGEGETSAPLVPVFPPIAFKAAVTATATATSTAQEAGFPAAVAGRGAGPYEEREQGSQDGLSDGVVKFVGECRLPIDLDEATPDHTSTVFTCRVYRETTTDMEHVVLTMGDVRNEEDVLTRLHSVCLTGDVFHSLRCDCGIQLRSSLAQIAQAKRGILVYLRGHEGRGIGLGNKIRAYAQQQRHRMDTYQANASLGFPPDMRSYAAADSILSHLHPASVCLLTNNPLKPHALSRVRVSSVRALRLAPSVASAAYVMAKHRREQEIMTALTNESPVPDTDMATATATATAATATAEATVGKEAGLRDGDVNNNNNTNSGSGGGEEKEDEKEDEKEEEEEREREKERSKEVTMTATAPTVGHVNSGTDGYGGAGGVSNANHTLSVPSSSDPSRPSSTPPLPVEVLEGMQADTTAITTAVDRAFMQRALRLAELGRVSAPPNPWVGCVLASNGHIVGEGYHHRAGMPHAEIEAMADAVLRAGTVDMRSLVGTRFEPLTQTAAAARAAGQATPPPPPPPAEAEAAEAAKAAKAANAETGPVQNGVAGGRREGKGVAEVQAGSEGTGSTNTATSKGGRGDTGADASSGAVAAVRALLRGCTAYVTLEPCHHQGRTGPCDLSLVRAGIERVVVAVVDPDQRVSSQGLARLRDDGVEVVTGVCRREGERLLAPYLHQRARKRPFVVVKTAVSIDGRIACKDRTSKWITGPLARRHAHKLRALSQAVLCGVGTALSDNPTLNVRLPASTLTPKERIVYACVSTDSAAAAKPGSGGGTARGVHGADTGTLASASASASTVPSASSSSEQQQQQQQQQQQCQHYGRGMPLLRAVLDARGRLLAGKLLDTSIAPTIIYTSKHCSGEALRVWKKRGVDVVVVDLDDAARDDAATTNSSSVKARDGMNGDGASQPHGASLPDHITNGFSSGSSHDISHGSSNSSGVNGKPVLEGGGDDIDGREDGSVVDKPHAHQQQQPKGPPSSPSSPPPLLLDLGQVLADLAQRGVVQVLVEGGAGVHASLLRDGCADQLAVFTGPTLLGGTALPWLPHELAGTMAEAKRYTLTCVHTFREDGKARGGLHHGLCVSDAGACLRSDGGDVDEEGDAGIGNDVLCLYEPQQ